MGPWGSLLWRAGSVTVGTAALGDQIFSGATVGASALSPQPAPWLCALTPSSLLAASLWAPTSGALRTSVLAQSWFLVHAGEQVVKLLIHEPTGGARCSVPGLFQAS